MLEWATQIADPGRGVGRQGYPAVRLLSGCNNRGRRQKRPELRQQAANRGPIRTGTGPSDRASRWKQLLVAVHDPIAALDVRLGREPASTLTGPLESAPVTRGRVPGVACHTSCDQFSIGRSRAGASCHGARQFGATSRGTPRRGCERFHDLLGRMPGKCSKSLRKRRWPVDLHIAEEAWSAEQRPVAVNEAQDWRDRGDNLDL